MPTFAPHHSPQSANQLGMTVTHIPTISEQLTQAVTQVRRYRHQPSCRCALYRGNDRAPFCTGGEATWSSIIDRLIDRALSEQPRRHN